jgi:fumarate reductase subunit C
MDWHHFINKAKDGYYTQFLMQLLSLVVIIIYFYIKPKTKPLRYLAIIAIASFIESWASNFADLIQNPIVIAIGTIASGTYLFIEVIYCFFYIKAHIQSRVIKRIISITPFVFIGYTIITVIIAILTLHTKTILRSIAKASIPYTFTIEGFLIIAACLYFFYELLVGNFIKEKFSVSATWAISGMLILSGSLTPFSLFEIYLFKNNRPMLHSLWPINYISYSILFITFAIAIISDKKTAATETAL